MKVVIIDDERLARNELRRLLRAHPGVELAGEAATIEEGLQLIAQAEPDLLLLDIQMPEGSGFDLLAALDNPPMVIFTTAYDQYAIRAFDANALDYLLKPIEADRLAQALRKCAARGAPATALAPVSAPPPALTAQAAPAPAPARPVAGDTKVFIRDGERCWFVALEQIALFESEGNYTRVYLERSRPLLLRSLNQLEAKLDASQFLRASRRHIVNLKFVTGMAPGPAGALTLTLQDDLKVSMSRRRAAMFKQEMKL
ncbi:LytR/AlgR family response regulator transcription factor [Rugamonas sp. CCM 8940]|uniref:LytR/AlgR family response regulator transcription factor n=1 Tax=Rugamonas sp. CCM 8940 TaxID=2765359 RepID=UPI0018F7BA6C|nr:LytTR family DNA-binding domain-containing protein [Rugamonas sp. CCM 8940]MBJ7309442.1 response regulator transcription factor [Rugamonas sp. CCM 8940]